jgi:hypothetical protein
LPLLGHAYVCITGRKDRKKVSGREGGGRCNATREIEQSQAFMRVL